MPFVFRFTCPEIDEQIDSMETDIRNVLGDDDAAISLIERITERFEYLRELNQEMRSEAEDLVTDLELQIHTLELQNLHLENLS